MIDFRYHLVSIIAVFMALAVGIALGSGPLKAPIANGIANETEQLRQDRRALHDENAALQKQADYTSTVTDQIAGAVTAGRLSGRRVVVVTTPDADSHLADQVSDELKRGGATVSATIGLTDAWVAPEKEAQLDELTSRLVPPNTPTFPQGESARRQRVSIILARGLVERKNATAHVLDQDAQALLAGLQDGGFVKVSGKAATRADFAVLVCGPGPAQPTDASKAQVSDLVTLSGALDQQDLGTVVAGPNTAAQEGGLIAGVRSTGGVSGDVSTVDAAETASGQLTIVLALVAQSHDVTGAYGYGPGAKDAMPDLSTLTGS